MTMSEYTDDLPFDEYEPSEAPTCKRCGAEDLEWVDIGGSKPRWRLFEGMKMHVCPAASVDDFEDLTKK